MFSRNFLGEKLYNLLRSGASFDQILSKKILKTIMSHIKIIIKIITQINVWKHLTIDAFWCIF